MIETAKIFTNGGSQAVRLPKACRFDDDEVLVQKMGNVVLLIPKNNGWASMFQSLDLFTDDFCDDLSDNLKLEERESL